MATAKVNGKRAKAGQLTASNVTPGESVEELWKSRTKIVNAIIDELKAIGVDASVIDFPKFEHHGIEIEGIGGYASLRVSSYSLRIGPWKSERTPFYEVCVQSGRRQTYAPKVDWKWGKEGMREKRIVSFVSPHNIRKIAERLKRDLEADAENRSRLNATTDKRGELLQHARKLNEIAGRNVVGVTSRHRLGPDSVRFVASLRGELTADEVERIVNAGITDLLVERTFVELEP